ncbi:MAG: ABC transporter permease [Gammaproteobacteria bacterium]
MFDLQGYGPSLLQGAWVTITVGLSAMLVAMLLGLLGAWGKLARNPLANLLAGTYTTVIRGIPELILLLLIYYGVPTLIQDLAESQGMDIRINLDPFVAGVITIGFIYGAFATEVFRGAFMAVPKGQIEAARAHGMGDVLTFTRVMFPQAIRVALPGLGNVWMVLIKATALVSLIQLDEIMRKAKIATNATHQPFTFYLLASLVFLAITILSMVAQHRAEKYANRGLAARTAKAAGKGAGA